MSVTGVETVKHHFSAKSNLAKGRLIESVKQDGLKVNLHLNKELNEKHFKSINKMFWDMYSCRADFRENFERPKSGDNQPCLELKSTHSYDSNEQILTALITFASVEKKKIGIKKMFATGELLTGVELLTENKVQLIFNADLMGTRNFQAINKTLLEIYKISEEFRQNFEKPIRSSFQKDLQLKEGHPYKNADEVLEALKRFAVRPYKAREPKRQVNSSSSLTGKQERPLKLKRIKEVMTLTDAKDLELNNEERDLVNNTNQNKNGITHLNQSVESMQLNLNLELGSDLGFDLNHFGLPDDDVYYIPPVALLTFAFQPPLNNQNDSPRFTHQTPQTNKSEKYRRPK